MSRFRLRRFRETVDSKHAYGRVSNKMCQQAFRGSVEVKVEQASQMEGREGRMVAATGADRAPDRLCVLGIPPRPRPAR